MSTISIIKKIVNSTLAHEGGGFLVRRPIDDEAASEVDPFLLLDHYGPKNHGPGEAVGAPDHPHRGFETVTYIVQGSQLHLDSNGGKGVVTAGGVQWMTAGRGVVHAEMPTDDIMKHGGVVEGFQLWINLPKKLKMATPRYQGIEPKKLHDVTLDDGKSFVKVIAGKFLDKKSPIETRFPIVILDARLEMKGSVTFTIPRGMNALAYCWRGSGHCETAMLKMSQAAVFRFNDDKDSSVTFAADNEDCMHILFLAGIPICEPVEREGPFAMNTKEEIIQAREDYKAGRFGEIKGKDERVRQTKAALAMQQKNYVAP